MPGPADTNPIALAYAAPYEAEGWDALLEAAAAMAGAQSGLLAAYLGPERASVAARFRLDPDAEQRWVRDFVEYDLWGDRGRREPVGRVNLGHELIDPSELKRSVIYHEVLRRAGIEDLLGVNLVQGPEGVAFLALYRDARSGYFDPGQRTQLDAFAKHLGHAMQISRRLAELEARHEALGAALDLVPFGILVLDPRGRILDANREARRALASGDGLATEQLVLRATRSPDRAALERTVLAACAGRGGGVVRVRRPSAARPWHLLVAPVPPRTSSAFLALVDRRPAALVIVSDPEAEPRSAADRLSSLFGLTRAEARLVESLVRGGSLSEYAEAACITVGTARGYLKSALQKTGTRRQGQLIAQVLRSVASLQTPPER